MFARSFALVLAVGALGAVGCVAGSDAAEGQASVSQNTGSPNTCRNQSRTVNSISVNDVLCDVSVSLLAITPVNVTVKDVRILNDNELSVLSDDLNNTSILDGNVLDQNKILNDLEVTALDDFLNKFDIKTTATAPIHNLSVSDIDVCTLTKVCI